MSRFITTKHTTHRSECGGTDIRTTTVAAGGGCTPDLLPGTHPWWMSGKLEVFVRTKCGHFQFFVRAELLERVIASAGFKRV
jgi:hypothetical protein